MSRRASKVLAGALRQGAFRVRHALVRHRLQRVDEVELLGLSLRVEPGVFHPALFRSSRLLAAYVRSLVLEGRRVLDMGTGSGLVGLCAARAGGRVVAVDVNPLAARCARDNAEANRLSDRMEVLEGDLFAPLGGRGPFDDVFWNPPFYRGVPRTAAERAWHAGPDYDVIGAFAARIAEFLSPQGRVVLVLSSDIELDHVRALFTSRGLQAGSLRTERGLFESLSLEEFRSPAPSNRG